MKLLVLIISLLAILQVNADVTRTGRGRLKSRQTAHPVTMTCDTLRGHAIDSLSVAGYDKPLRSHYESLFVVNHTDTDIRHIGLDITYFDSAGRMLNRVSRTLSVNVGSGQTRLIKFSSWDPQQAFYYYRSPKPKRVEQATPYRVKIDIIFATSDQTTPTDN